MNVNGALRAVSPKDANYVGFDVQRGPGVDAVIKPDAPLPMRSDIADIALASSVFEYAAFFWLTFLEMVRITKPGGFIYINALSNGRYHRYPADNWRFYPDCGHALEAWARHNQHPLTLVESFTAERMSDIWNDFVAIFVKSDHVGAEHPRFLSESIQCTNVWRVGESEPRAERAASEDMVLLDNERREKQGLKLALQSQAAPPSRSIFRWLPRRAHTRARLIPHVRVAFSNLPALLNDFKASAPESYRELRVLIQSFIRNWPFDEQFYLKTYPDVVDAIRRRELGSAYEHFLNFGYLEGRLPVDPAVDETWYLKTYPDVAAAAQKQPTTARDHYFKYGYREGRRPSNAAPRSQAAEYQFASGWIGARGQGQKSLTPWLNIKPLSARW
jgi:hypothetical protein